MEQKLLIVRSFYTWAFFLERFRGFVFYLTIFYLNMPDYPSGWRGPLAKRIGVVRSAEIRILDRAPYFQKENMNGKEFVYYNSRI